MKRPSGIASCSCGTYRSSRTMSGLVICTMIDCVPAPFAKPSSVQRRCMTSGVVSRSCPARGHASVKPHKNIEPTFPPDHQPQC